MSDSMRILLVDSEPLWLKLAQEVLAGLDSVDCVDTSRSLRSATERSSRAGYSVAVIDQRVVPSEADSRLLCRLAKRCKTVLVSSDFSVSDVSRHRRAVECNVEMREKPFARQDIIALVTDE